MTIIFIIAKTLRPLQVLCQWYVEYVLALCPGPRHEVLTQVRTSISHLRKQAIQLVKFEPAPLWRLGRGSQLSAIPPGHSCTTRTLPGSLTTNYFHQVWNRPQEEPSPSCIRKVQLSLPPTRCYADRRDGLPASATSLLPSSFLPNSRPATTTLLLHHCLSSASRPGQTLYRGPSAYVPTRRPRLNPFEHDGTTFQRA